MKKQIIIAAALSACFHLGLLFGFGNGENSSGENKVVVEDVALDQAPPPPPPVVKGEEENDAQVNDDVLLPEDLLSSGLADSPVSSVAIDALTETVKPEALRPPRPDSLQVGIPSGDQRKSASSAKAAIRFTLKDLDKIPQAIFKVAPQYPFDLRTANIKGEVIMILYVDQRGHVMDVDLVSATNPGFINNAVEAARKWRFEPGMRKGTAVSFKMQLPIKFNVPR
jgi:TonB family protein